MKTDMEKKKLKLQIGYICYDGELTMIQTKKVANWSVAKHQGSERTQAGGEKTTATTTKKMNKRRQILKRSKFLRVYIPEARTVAAS